MACGLFCIILFVGRAIVTASMNLSAVFNKFSVGTKALVAYPADVSWPRPRRILLAAEQVDETIIIIVVVAVRIDRSQTMTAEPAVWCFTPHAPYLLFILPKCASTP